MCLHVHMNDFVPWCTLVTRGPLTWVSYVLLPCEFQIWNSGLQAWWWVILLARVIKIYNWKRIFYKPRAVINEVSVKWHNMALPCHIVVRSASTIGSLCQGSLELPHVKANVAWDKFYGIEKNQSNLLPTAFIEGNHVVSLRNCYPCRMVLSCSQLQWCQWGMCPKVSWVWTLGPQLLTWERVLNP